MSTDVDMPAQPKRKLIEIMADRAGLEPDVFRDAVAKVAMPSGFSREEFAACLMVAFKYDLDPFTKQIYFMKTKGGSIQPIVSVDGWAHIANRHPAHDGMDFVDTFDDFGKLFSITCRIYRKDRSKPIEVTEYLAECLGSSPAWLKTPARMLRHRSLIQCCRYAYGIAGLMEPDEFEQWQANDITPVRKSAAESKRDGTGTLFNAIMSDMAGAASLELLDHILDVRSEELAKMPRKWAHLIEDEYNARKSDLADAVAASTEASA